MFAEACAGVPQLKLMVVVLHCVGADKSPSVARMPRNQCRP